MIERSQEVDDIVRYLNDLAESPHKFGLGTGPFKGSLMPPAVSRLITATLKAAAQTIADGNYPKTQAEHKALAAETIVDAEFTVSSLALEEKCVNS